MNVDFINKHDIKGSYWIDLIGYTVSNVYAKAEPGT